jgi:hypothetical protein
MPTDKGLGSGTARRNDGGDVSGSSPAASDRVHQAGTQAERRTIADTFAPETEPDWLRRRRITREAIPLELWRPTDPEDGRPDEAGGSTRVVRSISYAVIAALPLIVGLILLFLGYGPGQVTLQT